MKRALVIVPNILIIVFILMFIVRYANYKVEETNQNAITEYEKMTLTVNQIITNYLEDEQHLCDIWSNYVNSSAEAGTPMTAEEIVSYIRKAKISPEISGHLVFRRRKIRASPEIISFPTKIFQSLTILTV